ncbi:MAG: hypothetical protein ABW000_23970, partial [Actinoplanes sp.]
MPPYVEFTVVLRTGESLTEQAVSSPNGEFSLIHECSGNVSVRRNVDALLIWETGTGYRQEPTTTIQPGRWRGQGEGLARAGRLVLREDNTLAVLNHEGAELWVSPTREFPYLSLVLDDNGILTLMSKYGHLVWQYQDSADRAIVADGFSERPGRLLLRENGELVVLRVTGEQVWSAPAVGHTLVVTDAGRASLLG